MAIATIAISCKKSLDLSPQDKLSDATFWLTPTDFMLGANAFYSYERTFNDLIFDAPHSDLRGDLLGGNAFASGTNTIPVTDGNYTTAYTRIRNINYLLDKANSYATPADIAKYVAEAKFFRAYVYFDLLQQYGGVPIVKTLLAVNAPELQAPRNSRDEVADFIISDLQAAIPNLPIIYVGDSNYGRISAGAAQALLGRVALYEGTWQEFRGNTARANALLDISIPASKAVMSMNYSLFKPAILGDSALKYFHILEDEKSNPAGLQKATNNETILANRYSSSLRQIRINLSHTGAGGPVEKFAQMFLCQDGLPISKSPLFQGYQTMKAEYLNRDNRMRYTLLMPHSAAWSGNANWRVDWVNGPADLANASTRDFIPQGYPANQKWVTERQCADYTEGEDFPVIRLAEVYLNYAEAVFERNGAITDADLDISLNLVRQRVNKNMPKLSNAFVAANGLDMRTEIRRERAIELFCEGFRADDIKRWHTAVTELSMPLTGVKYTGTEYETTYPAGKNLPKTSDGFILNSSVRAFSEKNYLLPIPTQQIQLNPQLTQNPGWQ